MEQPEEHIEEQKDALDLANSFDVSRERVEGLWRQAMGQQSMVKNDLMTARASRSRAEMDRQRVSKEALEATREACDQLSRI